MLPYIVCCRCVYQAIEMIIPILSAPGHIEQEEQQQCNPLLTNHYHPTVNAFLEPVESEYFIPACNEVCEE